jgi:hypothetical protein
MTRGPSSSGLISEFLRVMRPFRFETFAYLDGMGPTAMAKSSCF